MLMWMMACLPRLRWLAPTWLTRLYLSIPIPSPPYIRIKQGNELYLWSLHLHHTPATGANQLIFLIHHALSDGDSINQLLQDLALAMSKQVLTRQQSRSRLVIEQSVLPQLPSADLQVSLCWINQRDRSAGVCVDDRLRARPPND